MATAPASASTAPVQGPLTMAFKNKNAADRIKEGRGLTIPTGRSFPSFPVITKMTRGCQGIMALVAATGAGKSLLAAHLAADLACEDFPVTYCDFENENLALYRCSLLHGAEHLRWLSVHSNYAEGLRELRRYKTGLVVLDTLTSSVGVAGDELSHWSAAMAGRMSEMNDLTKEGYSVLVVVQAGRGAYETGQCPVLKSAQYSSAIEQYASTVLGLWRNRASERFVRPIKNRFPVDAMYRQALVRIVVGEDERLREGILEF